jgi:hypothetical protein
MAEETYTVGEGTLQVLLAYLVAVDLVAYKATQAIFHHKKTTK